MCKRIPRTKKGGEKEEQKGEWANKKRSLKGEVAMEVDLVKKARVVLEEGKVDGIDI